MELRDDGEALILTAEGVRLFTYTYRPDVAAVECPCPSFHPIRTLAGDVVTGYRPHDHRWHKGLAMTASHLSGQNFWGGVSWVRGQGYQLRPNVGSLRHQGFVRPGVERVDWVTAAGETWIEETRTIAYHRGDDFWVLELGFDLRNVRGAELEFGSPTVFGRELAGYCGFFWRGPRDFTGGTVLASTGPDDPMGTQADWLAYIGTHDEVDRQSTLLFLNDTPVADARWFVRTEPYPVVNPSLAFYRPLTLATDDTLRLRYRLVIGNGRWTHDRLADHYGGRESSTQA
ncbi:PmoA family protein [Actinocrispum wychmicini]|uniref:Methane monooxygenase PmoA-like n=1 Tax=Actinocrispum wychmicini TaxID=1213861 RepID=A0A4R2J9S5_9PSEU|nr:PmoA family protein [Actinocrispum wychmicini]TCO55007.1 methane monooxygenase PmoA-like [Actinocrispum wychmicini]